MKFAAYMAVSFITLFHILLFHFVSFVFVYFSCKCVLYYCHWMSTQLQLTNISYHTVGKTWKAKIVFNTSVTNVPGFLPLLQFLLLCHKRNLAALFHSLKQRLSSAGFYWLLKLNV